MHSEDQPYSRPRAWSYGSVSTDAGREFRSARSRVWCSTRGSCASSSVPACRDPHKGRSHRGRWLRRGPSRLLETSRKDPIPVAIKCLKFNNTGPDKARYHVFIRRVCVYIGISLLLRYWRADYHDTANKARDSNMESSRALQYSSVLRIPAC